MERIIKKLKEKNAVIYSIAIFALSSFTPLIIRREIAGVGEETAETIILLSFSAAILLVFLFYAKRLALRSQIVDETMNRLGIANLQIQNLRSVFEDIKNFPETRLEFKMLAKGLAEKVLSIVNCRWIIFRLVETGGRHNTLLEYSQARGDAELPTKNKLSNKMLFDNEPPPGITIVSSNQNNLGIKTFCVLSVNAINENQKDIIGIIVNDLSAYYLLFVTVFQKKNRLT